MTDIYVGETLVADFSPEEPGSLEDIEEQLREEGIVDVDDDEELYVSVEDGRITVRKLRQVEKG